VEAQDDQRVAARHPALKNAPLGDAPGSYVKVRV
jgi:poly(3-hydroxyalkanoate) synthetase